MRSKQRGFNIYFVSGDYDWDSGYIAPSEASIIEPLSMQDLKPVYRTVSSWRYQKLRHIKEPLALVVRSFNVLTDVAKERLERKFKIKGD